MIDLDNLETSSIPERSEETRRMSHAKSGKHIQHAGRHRGASYDYDHHLAEEDSSVLRRAQDKQVVREALGESALPGSASPQGSPAH
jgi:hypothetical protein